MSKRTPKQAVFAGELSDSKKRLIKIAVRQLNMVDADYRALLKRIARVESSLELSLDGFDAVMAELHRLGFQYTPSNRKPKGVTGGSAPDRPTASQWRLLEERARKVGYSGLEDPRFIAWLRPRGAGGTPPFPRHARHAAGLGGFGQVDRTASHQEAELNGHKTEESAS